MRLLPVICFIVFFMGCATETTQDSHELKTDTPQSLDPTNDDDAPKAEKPQMELGSQRLILKKDCPGMAKPGASEIKWHYKKGRKMMVWIIEDPLWVTVYTNKGTLLYVRRSCFGKGK